MLRDNKKKVRPVRVLGRRSGRYGVELSDEVWDKFSKTETKWLSVSAIDELDAWKKAVEWLERGDINDES